MNPAPSRHPLFVAIACMSLFAAWSTPEAEVVTVEMPRTEAQVLGEALPPMFRATASLEADCLAHAGAQRALCVYAATRKAGVASDNRLPPAALSETKPVNVAQTTAGLSTRSTKSLRDDHIRLDRTVHIR